MLKMTNHELVLAVRALVREERRVSRAILEQINEVERRRLFVELGFTSTYEWLVKDLGYSASAAYRRISAARLLRAVPEVAEKIETGEVNLTTLAQAQTAIRSEERRTGERLSLETRASVVSEIVTKSSREVEAKLVEIFPSADVAVAERTRACAGGDVRLEVRLTPKQMQKIERARELLSHSRCGASIAEILEVVVDEFLNRKDPLLRTTQSGTGAGSVKRLTPALRRKILKRDGAKCQHVDPRTHRKCESRYQIEVDHIVPKALGGTNSLENLRALCRVHNQSAAEGWFGVDLMTRVSTRSLSRASMLPIKLKEWSPKL